MKKYLFLLAAIAAVSCSDSGDLDSVATDDGNQENNVTDSQTVTDLTFIASTSPISRVSVTENGDGWAVEWNEDDALGGWAIDSNVTEQSKFTTVEDSIDGDNATFNGSIPTDATSMRFVHPYDSSLSKSGDKITLSLASQSVGSDLSHLGSTSYMISQSIDDLTSEDQATINMTHIGAAVELKISFESADFDEADYSITSVVLGGDNLALPLAGELDITDGTFTTTSTGQMTIEADNVEAVDGYYYIRFCTFPITDVDGSTLDIEVTLSDASGATYTSTAAITAGGDFVASTKNTIDASISDPVDTVALRFLIDECDLTAPKPLIKWTDLGEDWVYTLSSQTWYEGDDAASSNWSQYLGCLNYEGTEYEVPLSLISGDVKKGQSAMPIFKLSLKGINTVTGEEVKTAGYPDVDDGTENLVFSPQVQGTFVDTRGDEVIEYGWVRLGTQVWMSESLKTTHTVSGDPLPCIAGQTYSLGDANGWADPALGLSYDFAPSGFFDGSISCSYKTYDFLGHGSAEANQQWYLENAGGYVYNIIAAMSDEVVPAGWHTMTSDDAMYMAVYTEQSMLSGSNTLTVTSTTGLTVIDDVTLAGTNDYGLSFTASVVRLPAYSSSTYGFRTNNGDFMCAGNYWYLNYESIAEYVADPTLGTGTIQTKMTNEERVQFANATYYGSNYIYVARWDVSNHYCIRCVMTDDE